METQVSRKRLGSVSGKKKRKQRCTDSIDDEETLQRKLRCSAIDEVPKIVNQDGFQWKNLQLILSLQDKIADVSQKVDLAFNYVQSSSTEVTDDINYCSHVIDISRTVSFLSNWVQSILISSEKKMRLENDKPEFGATGSTLDIRCWQVLRFCLSESKKFLIPLTFSKDFLRVIRSIAVDMVSCLNSQCSGERLQLYDMVSDCVSFIFSSGGVTNENLEQWILVIDEVLELILKGGWYHIEDSRPVNLVFRFSCYVFEPFARFLRTHSIRKNGFNTFIDKLLQPLLHLVHFLHTNSCGNQDDWRADLLKLVEQVLSQGLFHSVHIEGFLSLRSSSRYGDSSDSMVKEEKTVNKSYHRHLFNKVEKIVTQKNESALMGLGELLYLFSRCALKNKAASVSGGVLLQLDGNLDFHDHTNIASESMDGEMRKSIFDFFVQIMEYLLADLNKYLQLNEAEVSVSCDVPITLRSINNLLARFISEKLYVRTEDTSNGDSQRFLRFIYASVMPLSAKIVSEKTSDDGSCRELFVLVRKELIITVRHLLDIEYNVVGDDIESLWTLALTSLPYCRGSMDFPEESLLFAEILNLGCGLLDLYSDLRQVDTSIFALCRAVRHYVSSLGHSVPPGIFSLYGNSISMLFCSLQFRHSLSIAIKTIPEGHVANCIRQLCSDIKASLEWIQFGRDSTVTGENAKANLQLYLQAEILGKALSDVYTIILDSVRITWGNSSSVGDSLKVLIEVIRPSLSCFISRQQNSSNELCILIDGRRDNLSTCWMLKFVFHLLLLSKSVFRQVISHMPSDTAKEMSSIIGDPFLAQSINACLEIVESSRKGFFSWIVEPSMTLPSVIKFVSNICIQDAVVLCPPLIYVLTSMAIQRLVDLNKMIEISDYILNWDSGDERDDADLSPYSKKSISKVKKETSSLTKFIMENVFSSPSFAIGRYLSLVHGRDHFCDTLKFSVGALDEESLPSALLYKICSDVDIWCTHASKKDLKNFLTLLIQSSVSYINDEDRHVRTQNVLTLGQVKKVNMQQVALEILINKANDDALFIRRYAAARFCKLLKKSVSSFLSISSEDLGTSPDWVEVIYSVENLSDMQPWAKLTESCNKPSVEFMTCQSLLNLLTWMLEESLDSKSLFLYVTHVLNLERLLVCSLLGQHQMSSSPSMHQIVQLFATCRTVLKILAVASIEANVAVSHSPKSCKITDNSFPLLWLLKSLYLMVEFQCAFPEDIGMETKGTFFSMLDHTSDLLWTISRNRFKCAVRSLDLDNRQGNLKMDFDVLESVAQLFEPLQDYIQKSVNSIKDGHLGNNVEFIPTFQHLRKLSASISCYHGLLGGIASVFGEKILPDGSIRMKISSCNVELVTRLDSCVNVFVNSTASILKLLFLEDGVNLDTSTVPNLEAFLTEVQHRKFHLQRKALSKILSEENADMAVLLRHLFISFAAILRLNLQINITSSFWSVLTFFIGISQFLLSEASKYKTLHCSTVCCLDGAVKLLKELGKYFRKFDSSSRDLYTNLIGLHLTAIGKCISLQGKDAKLASQESGSLAKKLSNRVPSSSSQLSVLKKRLRTSFKTYVKNSLELHLNSTVQAVERALSGVRDGLTVNSSILFGSSNGGEVSTVVAASIDGLDLLLECVTGKRINAIKRHMPSLVSCLYNIILHLQAPGIFSECTNSVNGFTRPDPGSIIHICVELLTKILGKPNLFQIDACHVAESLRVPGALFQYFLQLRTQESSTAGASKIGLINMPVDRKFSVELYASCCHMLHTALKNHTTEARQCFAILQDSVAILLRCLENVSATEVVSWNVQEIVTCASSLRRVFEEVRQQKDMLGQYSFLLLSQYISAYCGFGPTKNGIRSEADNALRPGMYALLDCCSPDDLQLLHTQFGEDSCGALLLELQHEYKIKFRFEGKI